MPKVTVGIAVYNGAPFIGRAIKSVLEQTLHDFELIIVNDGSTDATLEEILSFRDDRIIVLNNEVNRGVTFTRNRYLLAAKGRYIAILDADDAWYPEKLEEQIAFLDANTQIGACGCYGMRINTENVGHCWTFPLDYEDIKIRLLWGSAAIHSSLVVRKAILDTYDIRYAESLDINGVEDYMILSELVQRCPVVNLPHCLLDYFEHGEQFTSKKKSLQIKRAFTVTVDYLKNSLGLTFSDREYQVYTKLFGYDFDFTPDELRVLADVLIKIDQQNKPIAFFDAALLKKALVGKWYMSCYHSNLGAKDKIRIFYGVKPFIDATGVADRIKYFLKAILSKGNRKPLSK